MDKTTIIALFDALLEDRLSEMESNNLLEGPRGIRGLKGRSGKDFIFEDYQEKITEIIQATIDNSKDTLKLRLNDLTIDELQLIKMKFDDLTAEEKESLRGKRGATGQRGSSGPQGERGLQGNTGKSLKFDDLTAEEKESLRGPQGTKGRDGKGFIFEENSEKIASLILDHKDFFKLTFEDLSESEKLSLKGEKGPRGQRGRSGESFDFEQEKEKLTEILHKFFNEEKSDFKLKFSDLSSEEIDVLKLKFEQLTPEEKLSLKGEKGSRGQRGKTGKEGERGIQGLKGPRGVPGLPGVVGRIGPQGTPGIDGKNASEIIEVELKTIGKDEFYFVFYFDDGTQIETNAVEFPPLEQIVNMYMSASGGGGTAASSEHVVIPRLITSNITVESDTTLLLRNPVIYEGVMITVEPRGEILYL